MRTRTITTIATMVALSAAMIILAGRAAALARRVIVSPAPMPASLPGGSNFGWSLDMQGSLAAIGAPDDYVAGSHSGAVYVYAYAGSSWQLQARLVPGDGRDDDAFGHTIAIDGTTIVVGAPFEDTAPTTNQGAAYVFERVGSTWVQRQKILPGDPVSGGQFGSAVALSGGTLVAGEPYYRPDQYNQHGLVHVYQKVGSGWLEQARLFPSAMQYHREFGTVLALAGDTLIAGAPAYLGNGGDEQGAAFVYARSGTNWMQQATLVAPTPCENGHFGQAIDLDGSRLVISAPGDDSAGDNAGAVYLYEHESGGWSYDTRLTLTSPLSWDAFGSAVAISDGLIVVGAMNVEGAYVFEQTPTGWREQVLLTASEEPLSDWFGVSVEVENDLVLAGAPLNDRLANNAGAVYSWTRLPSTTVVLQSSPHPSTYKQTVTLRATVTSPTSGTPTGFVTFYDYFDGYTSLGQAYLNQSGEAVLFVSELMVGSHRIVADYDGDSRYMGSTSPAITHRVLKAPTRISLSSSENPAVYGQFVTLQARVTSDIGIPDGTVSFTGLPGGVSTLPLAADGTASLVVRGLAVGTHPLLAYYSGTSLLAASQSPVLIQTIEPPATETALTSSASPSVYGQSVTFRATVTGGLGQPSGEVVFYDDTAELGTVQLDSSGTASLTTARLAVGQHRIQAWHNGGNTGSSTSPILAQQVNPAPLVVTADHLRRPYGAANPPLTVTYSGFAFDEDASVLDHPVVVSTLATESSVPGDYDIVASRAADVNYAITFVNGTLTIEPTDAMPLITAIDSGFRPDRDGYRFVNYFDIDFADFTIEDMRTMFGDSAVCVGYDGATCLPSETARRWHDFVNKEALHRGHSEGMAASSLVFFEHLDDPANYMSAAAHTHDLQLQNVRRLIAYYTVEQYTNPVQAYRQESLQHTPAAILLAVYQGLALNPADPVTLYIQDRSGQHSRILVPYTIVSGGNGIFELQAYDSERPDDLACSVQIDTNVNEWNYSISETSVWNGYKNDGSIAAVPLSRYVAPQEVPPFLRGLLAQDASLQIWFVGSENTMISDSQGRRIGFDGARLTRTMADAYRFALSGDQDRWNVQVYAVPASERYTTTLDAATRRAAQFGPGYAVVVDRSVAPAAAAEATQDVLEVAPAGTSVTYTAGSPQESDISIAGDIDQASVGVEFGGVDLGSGDAIDLALRPEQGTAVFSNRYGGNGVYVLTIWHTTPGETRRFVSRRIPVAAGATHMLDYEVAPEGGWAVRLQIDDDSDGGVDQTVLLDPQAGMLYLPLAVR